METPDPYMHYGDKTYFDEGTAIAVMLLEGDLYVWIKDNATVIYVLCNDLFAWALADGEDLPYDEIEPLYKMWKADPKWGSAKWCCKQRNMQPQPPVKKDMIKDGVWEEWMDRLDKNPAN